MPVTSRCRFADRRFADRRFADRRFADRRFADQGPSNHKRGSRRPRRACTLLTFLTLLMLAPTACSEDSEADPSSGGSSGEGGGGSGEGGSGGGDGGSGGGEGGSDNAGAGGQAGEGGEGGVAGEAGDAGSGGLAGLAGGGGGDPGPVTDPRCDDATPDALLGAGSAEDPYLICLPEHLSLLDSAEYELDQAYALGDDLDVSALEPAFATRGEESTPLSGSFDGRKRRISGLPATLFGSVAPTGSIVDLEIAGSVDATAEPLRWGLLTDTNAGTVRAVHAEGTFQTQSHAGILIGANEGLVELCSGSGSITAVGAHIGGLVGVNTGTVRHSFSDASVTGNTRVGGLVGRQSPPGLIEESYSLGPVTGSLSVGGLVGTVFGGDVTNSYAISELVSAPEAGGLVGHVTGPDVSTIANSYAAGAVSGEGAQALIGALDAESNDSVTDCYFLAGPESSVGTELTSEEMQMEQSFLGWDFDTVWKLDPEISEFPSLQFQEAP